MTDVTISSTDYLKYAAAEGNAILEAALDSLGWLTVDHPEIEEQIERVQDMLDAVRNTLVESAAVFCRDGNDLNTYDDGRPVRTRLDLELGNYYEQRWHPYQDHRINRPHEVATFTTTSGKRKRVVVTAPGHLDAVDVTLRPVE